LEIKQMLVGARGDLRRMRHRHHLDLAGQPRKPRADRVRHRAADAGIDFVEHQRGRRAAVGQHHLERQQEARQLAAGGDLHQRARLGARIGLHPELDAVDALRPRRVRVGFDLVMNFARSSFSGASSALTALLSFSADLVRGRGQLLGSRAIALVGLGRGGFQLLQPIRAGIDQRDVGDEFGGERRQPVDRRRIFARGGAQRKQPLLDALQLGGIEIGRDQGGAEMLVGLFQRVDRDIDRPSPPARPALANWRRGVRGGVPRRPAPAPANGGRRPPPAPRAGRWRSSRPAS
jgi:hypothetical protein